MRRPSFEEWPCSLARVMDLLGDPWHGRDHVEYVKLVANHDGKMVALQVDCYANVGGYISGMAPVPHSSGVLCGSGRSGTTTTP